MSYKGHKYKLILDVLMTIVSIFLAIDYSLLIEAGDNSLTKKLAFSAWIFMTIGWTVKLIYDLKQYRKV